MLSGRGSTTRRSDCAGRSERSLRRRYWAWLAALTYANRLGELAIVTAFALAGSIVMGTSAFKGQSGGNHLFVSSALAESSDNSLSRELAKEQKRIAREMEREAAKQAKQMQRDAEKLARDQQKEADRLIKEGEKQAREQQKDAERLIKEAEKQAREQQKEAERLAKDAEKQAREQQKEAERLAKDAEKQAREQQKEAERQVKESEKQAKAQQKESERLARESEKQAKEQQREQERSVKQTEREHKTDTSISVSKDQNPRQEPRTDPLPTPTIKTAQPIESSGGSLGTTHTSAGATPVYVPSATNPDGGLQSTDGSVTAAEPLADIEADTVTDATSISTPAQIFEQLFSSAPKPKKADIEPVHKVKEKSVPEKAVPGGRLPVLELDVLEIGRPEVLAINPTPQTLARAEALGFRTHGAAVFSSLDYGVTRLLAPEGMTAEAAETLLAQAEPNSNVSVNHSYSLVRTATGTSTPAQEKSAPALPAGSGMHCGIDHCFGLDIVGWKPQLRSCASGLKIGIIDTSVDLTHPALLNKKIEVRHLSPGNVAGPDWHGTGVAALLAGDTSSGTPGLIPGATFYVADIFRSGPGNEPASDTVSMLRALDWLETENVKIINLSLSGPPDDLLAKAIKKLAAKGVIFVAAAGNGGPAAAPSYPAAYDEVIAVTAVGQNLKSYTYANRGSYIDVAAPGVAIWTAQPGSMEGYRSGTSFATPYVTAALAAIYARLPGKTSTEALAALSYRDLGARGPDAVYGQGLLIAPSSCAANQIAATPPLPANRAEAAAIAKPAGVGAARVLAPISAEEELPWLRLDKAN
jgi:Subtilase family